MTKGILLLEPLVPSAIQLVEKSSFEIYDANIDPYKKTEIVAVITRGKGQITADLMKSLPALKVVAKCGVGLDNVDLEFATEHGIQVLNTPGVNASTVAEHTMTLMLLLQRQVITLIHQVKKGDWLKREQYSGDELRGKTLGIVGMGNIGLKTAQLASCFGMKVIYWNRSMKEVAFDYKSLNDLLSSSDIISLHLPLQVETKNFIGAEQFRIMKKDAILINTARGGVVDHQALLSALMNGQLQGYGADVIADGIPDQDHPLLQLDNVLVTPHASSLTKQTFEEIGQLSVSNTLKFLENIAVEEKYLANNPVL